MRIAPPLAAIAIMAMGGLTGLSCPRVAAAVRAVAVGEVVPDARDDGNDVALCDGDDMPMLLVRATVLLEVGNSAEDDI